VKFTQAGLTLVCSARMQAGQRECLKVSAPKIFAHQRELFVVSMLRTGYRAGVIRVPALEAPWRLCSSAKVSSSPSFSCCAQVFTLFELIQIQHTHLTQKFRFSPDSPKSSDMRPSPDRRAIVLLCPPPGADGACQDSSKWRSGPKNVAACLTYCVTHCLLHGRRLHSA
jgi:hypothetical protein